MAAATVTAANNGNNGRSVMAVAVEQDLSGTKRRHNGNGSVNIGAVEGDSNDSLSKNSSEITAK